MDMTDPKLSADPPREMQDDSVDVALPLARQLTASGQTVSLDAVLARFGFTREALLAEEVSAEGELATAREGNFSLLSPVAFWEEAVARDDIREILRRLADW